MNVTLKIYDGSTWAEHLPYNRAAADFRLDEQLDTGSVQIIASDSQPIRPMSMTELIFSDGENTLSLPAYGFDMVEIRGTGYCVHNLTLCEPTRRFMGILIDGVKVTQPTDESGEAKKSLYEVAQRLLKTYALMRAEAAAEFTVTTDPDVVSLLENTEAPEFTWEAETLLWECLKDIGNVINCMPRLEFNADKTDFSVLTFDRINEVTEEREL